MKEGEGSHIIYQVKNFFFVVQPCWQQNLIRQCSILFHDAVPKTAYTWPTWWLCFLISCYQKSNLSKIKYRNMVARDALTHSQTSAEDRILTYNSVIFAHITLLHWALNKYASIHVIGRHSIVVLFFLPKSQEVNTFFLMSLMWFFDCFTFSLLRIKKIIFYHIH